MTEAKLGKLHKCYCVTDNASVYFEHYSNIGHASGLRNALAEGNAIHSFAHTVGTPYNERWVVYPANKHTLARRPGSARGFVSTSQAGSNGSVGSAGSSSLPGLTWPVSVGSYIVLVLVEACRRIA